MCVCLCVCICVCACVCICVCPPSRLLITSGMIQISYDWLNKDCSFYMAAVAVIGGGCGLRIEAHHRNQSNKSKLSLYQLLPSL